nr:hypothetical protein BaRGS_026316 [Batillaria attramentaria]
MDDRGVGEGSRGLDRDDDMSSWSWEAAFHGSVHTATLAVATVLALFVLVLGTFGNGLVLISACRRRKVRSNFDLLILNLAGADLLLCVLLAPLYLYTLFADPPAPRAFCGAFLFGGTGCGLLSLLSIVAIAIHRQARVVGRAKRALSSRQTGLVWRRAATLGRQTDPLVQEKDQVKTKGNKKVKDTEKTRMQQPVVRDCHCCSCQAAAERENKAVTMCLVVILTLVLCWSPLVVSQFIELATGPSIILLQVKLCGIALVFLNSALDPYIYAQNQGHFKHRFGRLFWEMLRCECSNPSRTRFRALRTRPLAMPRSSVLEVDTHSLPQADRGVADLGEEGDVRNGDVRNEGVRNEEQGKRLDGPDRRLIPTWLPPGNNNKTLPSNEKAKRACRTDVLMGAWQAVIVCACS